MAGEFREDLRERLPGLLTRGDGGEFDVRMMQQQAHEFLAGVTGGADDGCFFHDLICGSFPVICCGQPGLNTENRTPTKEKVVSQFEFWSAGFSPLQAADCDGR
jgi:hypothetical protein